MTNRNAKLIAWFNFCEDFRLYDAVAAIYYTQVTGSYTLGLSIFSVGTISSALLEVPTGIFSDLIGRKKTLVLGALCGALAVASYAVGGSYWVLVVGALFSGSAQALGSGNNDALLYDSLREEGKEAEFAEVQGKASSMFQFALGISALLGSLVLGFQTFKWVFWLSVIPQVLCVVIGLRMTEPKRHSGEVTTNVFAHLKESWLAIKNNYRLRLLSCAQILDRGLGEALHQFSPAFIATLWPIWAIGLARVGSHAFAALGMRKAGWFVKKWGEIKVLIFSSFPSYVISLLIIIFPSIATPAINAVTSLPFGLSHIARGSLLHKEFTDRQRATIASINSLASSILFGVLVFGLGFLADRTDPRIALLTGEVFSIIGVGIYLKLGAFSKANSAA